MNISFKYKAKFYKFKDDNENLTISINVKPTHKIDDKLLDDLTKSIDQTFSKDYFNENVFKVKKEAEANEKQSIKNREQQQLNKMKDYKKEQLKKQKDEKAGHKNKYDL